MSFSARMEWLIRSKAFLWSKRTTLTVEPFPSVCFVQACSILIKAWVVEDLGTDPNWLSLIFLIRTGLTCVSTINSSATLDNIGVSEIRRRYLFTSLIGFCFGMGTTSASFQEAGRHASRYCRNS